LRLLFDTDHPEAVRGTLQAARQGQERQSFRSEAELWALLKRLAEEQEAARSSIDRSNKGGEKE